MSKYKCVIFDCDGVLVDSEIISNTILVAMANELGANIDLNFALEHFKGNSMQKCVEKIQTLIPSQLPEDFVTSYRERSYQAFKNEIKPIQGVTDIVKNLDKPFCVASSGPEDKMRLNLNASGLLPFFEGNIFSCYTIGKWKPDPEIFLWAARSMGFQPEDCIVIEDSRIGIEAARAGGFDVYAYTAHDQTNQLASMATMAFDDMRTLSHYL